MRWKGTAIALAVLAAQATHAPAAHAQDKPAPKKPAVHATQPRTHHVQRGIFRMVTADQRNPDGSTHDVTRPVLELPNGKWVDLHVGKGTTPSYNAPVEVSGVGTDTQLDVEKQTPLTMAEYAATTAPVSQPRATSSNQPTTGTTSVLVILAYWTQPDAVTPASAANVIFTQGNPWWKETSYGQLGITGKVTNWVHISPPGGDCYSDGGTIMSRARTAASSYNPGAYQRVIVYFPTCSGSPGWAYVGAGTVWINGSMDLRVTIHEQGHNYGLGHAHSYVCSSGGHPTTLTGSCNTDEYGDPFDSMGGGAYVGHFSGRNKNLLHWLGGGRKSTTSSGGFILTPLESPTGLKTVEVPVTGARSYWVEYRVATGKDKSFPPGGTGVQVRLEDSNIGDGGPALLDVRPGDSGYYSDFDSVSVPAGSSWTSPEGVRISVTSASGSEAEVHVAGGVTPTKPSAPTAVKASAGDASATVSWTRPASDNGSILTGYVVTSSPGGKTATLSSLGGLETTAAIAGLTNGTAYTFVVTAKNALGSTASTPSAAVTPIAAVPTVHLTAPTAGVVVTGDSTPLTVAVAASTLSKSPINYVEYEVDGAFAASSQIAPFSGILSTTELTPGPHVVRATAYDKAGRSARSAPVSLTYAPPVPAVSITSPTANAAITTSAVTINLEALAGSPSHPLYSVMVKLEDGSYAGTAQQDSDSSWSLVWDLSGLAEGPHTLTAFAADDLQRLARSTTITVVIQHPAPIVSLATPTDGSTVFGTGTVTFDVGANPLGGGAVQSAEVVVDGVTQLGTQYLGYPGTETSTWSVDVNWRSLGNGPHTITAKAVNELGFGAVTPPRSFIVHNPTPTAVLQAPATSPIVGPVTLHATVASDPPATGAAIVYASLYADGTYLAGGTDNGGGDWSFDWDTTAGDQGSHLLSVQVQDADGYGGVSDGLAVTLDNPGPAVVLTSPAPDSILSGDVPLTATATTNPSTSADVYQVAYQLDAFDVSYSSTGPTWDAVLTHDYLTAGPHQVRARVYDVNGLARSSDPVPVMVVSKPDPPSGVSTVPGTSSVAMTWTAPEFTGGAPLSGYRVQRMADDYSTVLQSVDLGPGVTSYELGGLTTDTVLVQVVAFGLGGDSYAAGPTYVDLAPKPVTAFTANGGDRALTLHWTPSASTDISWVSVLVAPGTTAPDPFGGEAASLTATDTGTTLTSLTAATTYTVSVIVHDQSGASSPAVTTTLLGTAIATAASPGTVSYGVATTASTTLSRGATRLAGKTVTLYQRRHGTAPWSKVGTFVTGATGAASSKRVPTVNTDFLWSYGGSATEMGGSGPIRVVGVAPKVGITMGATRISLGKTVIVSGTVSPNHHGQRIYLQQKVGTGWKNITSAALSSTSTTRITLTGRVRGTAYYRLYKPADPDHTTSWSATKPLTVT